MPKQNAIQFRLSLAVLIFFSPCIFLNQLMGFEREVRPAAVAGLFYPKDPDQLSKTVNAYLKNSQTADFKGEIKGLVVPHAGYVYSGIVAGAGYRHIGQHVKKVMILAPSHHAHFQGFSVTNVQYYQTPLGRVPISITAKKIQKEYQLPDMWKAHEKEHSLEVQLPFLQTVLKEFELIPIVFGRISPQRAAKKLLPYIDDKTLVVASSDLSHYYPYRVAQKKDANCMEGMVQYNEQLMRECEACGKIPVLTLMKIAQAKGWVGQKIDYKNSGDTAGQKDRVVGYGCMAFVQNKEGQKKMTNLTTEEKQMLITLARQVIGAKLGVNPEAVKPQNPGATLSSRLGCFVTLQKNGSLRGCIGNIEPVKPLVDGVFDNALNSAFHDSRFPPVKKDEFSDLEIEISVLTKPTLLEFTDGEDLLSKLRPGVHGVILSKGWHKATFLPQVWDQLPSKKVFLSHLCQKAGMGVDCWQNSDLVVEIYEVAHFSEE